MLEAILSLYVWMCMRILSALLVAFTFLVFALILDFIAELCRGKATYTPWWNR